MAREPTPAARRALPARPNLDHLRNEAKQRLKALRTHDPQAKLAAAQLAVARDYGFASWRRLKAHIDKLDAVPPELRPVFAAARGGDAETVRRAFVDGFDPAAIDYDGKTVHQIAKTAGHQAIELIAREFQELETRPADEEETIDAILDAAENGRLDALRQLIDAYPRLINARGGNFQKQTALHKAAWHNHEPCVRLLIERGADVRIRDHGDNAYPLHFAAEAADMAIVKLLVEGGSDVIGEGDDHGLGVLGWATCFGRAREEVAEYLLQHGARLDLWSAIALDGVEDVRRLVTREPALLTARMSRNEHHRTPLHHAAAKNRPNVVRLLIALGADVNATEATGGTPLTTAAQENADAVVALLLGAGAKLDFIAALTLKRYDAHRAGRA
jgi:ankyrin repeat protein